MNKLFTVMVGCYGDFPQYSVRCLNSVVHKCDSQDNFELFVACNECGDATLQTALHYQKKRNIDTLFVTSYNINKDPTMRILLQNVRTEFAVWMDDDSHFSGQGWDTEMVNFLKKDREKPLDVAGHVYFFDVDDPYEEFLKKRPWHMEEGRGRKGRRVTFSTGGIFVARTSFLRYHDWPDAGMVKKHDDILLGDLCAQHGGNLEDFSKCGPLFSKISISEGGRRGGGEGEYGKH